MLDVNADQECYVYPVLLRTNFEILLYSVNQLKSLEHYHDLVSEGLVHLFTTNVNMS